MDFQIAPLTQLMLDFIAQHIQQNPNELRLKYAKKDHLPYSFLISQIEARQRLEKKNPTWAQNQNLLFPPQLSVEQSSSQITAWYKTQIISGNSLADITGGLGIDALAFAQVFKKVFYFEQDQKLCEILKYNQKILGIENVKVTPGNSIQNIKNQKFNWIYTDPARRKNGAKLVSFHDCEPNIIENLELLFESTENILVKASPLIDLKKAVAELQFVHQIYVVSVKNDCKEVLFKLHHKPCKKVEMKAINFTHHQTFESIDGTFPDLEKVKISEPLTYLYEPNASIMKSQLHGTLCQFFNVFKLHPNSNVYTSNHWIEHFPGKKLKIISVEKPYKQKFKNQYLNIVTRNYKEKPEQIKKKLKNKDGGEKFLFATTNHLNKPIFILGITPEK